MKKVLPDALAAFDLSPRKLSFNSAILQNYNLYKFDYQVLLKAIGNILPFPFVLLKTWPNDQL